MSVSGAAAIVPRSADPTAKGSSTMATGIVKFFNADRGFGFLSRQMMAVPMCSFTSSRS